jgi:hypothetical protein
VPTAIDPVGFMLLDPGPGEHDVVLRFETPLENRVGQAISMLAWLAVALLVWRPIWRMVRRPRRRAQAAL